MQQPLLPRCLLFTQAGTRVMSNFIQLQCCWTFFQDGSNVVMREKTRGADFRLPGIRGFIGGIHEKVPNIFGGGSLEVGYH